MKFKRVQTRNISHRCRDAPRELIVIKLQPVQALEVADGAGYWPGQVVLIELQCCYVRYSTSLRGIYEHNHVGK